MTPRSALLYALPSVLIALGCNSTAKNLRARGAAPPESPRPARVAPMPKPSDPAKTPVPTVRPILPAQTVSTPTADAAPSGLVPPAGDVLPKAGTPEMVDDLLKKSAARIAALDGYQARMTHKEFERGRAKPEEVTVYQWRPKPYAIRMKWVGAEANGREVAYGQGLNGGMVVVRTARGDMFPLSPPSRMEFKPDDPTLRSKGRRDLREAGLNEILADLNRAREAMRRDPAGPVQVRHVGAARRPESPAPLEAVERTLPPQADPRLPRGGKRVVYFETRPDAAGAFLPCAVVTLDADGRETDVITFDRVLAPVKLEDADFAIR